MKYLSTFLFLAAMIWTWNLATLEPAVSQQAHADLQMDLKRLISEYIQENVPNSSNLRFERFWTEATTENQVKATFTYSFEDATDAVGNTRVLIDGSALVNRVSEDRSNIEWSLDESSIHVLSNSVEYKDPLQVTPGADAAKPIEESN